MSIRSAADEVRATDASDPMVRLAFVGNVHRMLSLGYGRLDPAIYHAADENRLTQVFVAALRQVSEDVASPSWAAHFAVHEKQRQNDGELQGNSRLELDIVFERTQRGPHPTFVIEAKRLGPAHPVETYLEEQGLGAFISCEYAADHNDAGMLGYVQSKTVEEWCDSLDRKLGVSPGEHHVDANGCWQRHIFRDGPPNTYRSRHLRARKRGPITIYHTLLDFTA